MQLLLNDIADVSIGLTMRGRAASKRADGTGLHLLRIGDISSDGRIEIASSHPVEPGFVGRLTHRLQAGDIVMANRGTRMTAAIVPPETKAIASGQLFTIRLKSGRVSREYLHWYLNLPATQDQLFAHARGSYVKTLSVRVLKELEVPVPSMETQHNVVELAALGAREADLVEQIAQLKKKYLDAVLTKMAHQEAK